MPGATLRTAPSAKTTIITVCGAVPRKLAHGKTGRRVGHAKELAISGIARAAKTGTILLTILRIAWVPGTNVRRNRCLICLVRRFWDTRDVCSRLVNCDSHL